jgi:hypothetical protein
VEIERGAELLFDPPQGIQVFGGERPVQQMESEVLAALGAGAALAHGRVGRRPVFVVERQCDVDGRHVDPQACSLASARVEPKALID